MSAEIESEIMEDLKKCQVDRDEVIEEHRLRLQSDLSMAVRKKIEYMNLAEKNKVEKKSSD